MDDDEEPSDQEQVSGQSTVTEHEPEESEVVAEEPAEMVDENEKTPDISITPGCFLWKGSNHGSDETG